jgi:ABC-2 type transport system ATP-binding protein
MKEVSTILSYAIETHGLTKIYDHNFIAVDHIDLKVPKGRLFGFLGPNGAGKTTTLSMLSTLRAPTEGTAQVLGYDLFKEFAKIRKIIGICPQDLVFYPRLTARENMTLIAKLYGMNSPDYRERIDDLLGRMNLLEWGDVLAKKFSGGMKRRLNVIMAVVHNPELIFFDEPSAGLDPQSRRVVWDFIRDFEKQNATVILTTHNMEEADDLSSYINIIDHGKIIAQGTPMELKGKLGEGDIIEFKVEDGALREGIATNLKKLNFINLVKIVGKRRILLNGKDCLRRISEIMETVKVKMLDISIRQNTLEDVFISLTGRRLRDQ